MTFDVITIFPEFFGSILEHGLLKRAMASGHAAIRLHDLRDFTDDRHRTVDDRPFGGGPGMVFKPEPIFRAVEALRGEGPESSLPVILLSPQGRLLTQAVAEELSHTDRLVLICGRYEGVDERVAENLATDEISIGDFVLSGAHGNAARHAARHAFQGNRPFPGLDYPDVPAVAFELASRLSAASFPRRRDPSQPLEQDLGWVSAFAETTLRRNCPQEVLLSGNIRVIKFRDIALLRWCNTTPHGNCRRRRRHHLPAKH